MYKPKLPTNVGPLKWIGPAELAYADSGLIHYVYLPEEASSSGPVPVVVMLHGWGGDESAMWVFKRTLPPGVAAFTVRAPLEQDGGGFAWFFYKKPGSRPIPDSLEAALSKLDHFLTSLPRLYPVDLTRLVLIGFSQGATVNNTYILIHPLAAIGVASLAGIIPQMPGIASNPNRLTGLPVFIAHGTRDDIIPLDAAHRTRDLFIKLGAAVTYNEYPGAHKMHLQGIKDLKLWLAKRFPMR